MPIDQNQYSHAMAEDPETGKPMQKVAATLTGSIVGYSTDVKPMTGNQKGYSFLELDTKNIYFWDGVKWVLF